MNNHNSNLSTNNSPVPFFPPQQTTTLIPSKKIQDPKELPLYNLQNIAKFIKTDSHTQTKLIVYQDPFRPTSQNSILSSKILHIFQHKKFITTLSFTMQPRTASETMLTLSQLKDLQNLTSLNLELLSNDFCTPYFLKNLSLILGNLKKLISFRFSFPFDFSLFPEIFSSLFFALPRLNALRNLSLNFDYASSSNNPKWLMTLTSRLKKLPHLKSFSLTLNSCYSIDNFVLSSLTPAFKRLEALSIRFFEFDFLRSDDIFALFVSLGDSKSLRNLDLSFESSPIDTTEIEPISKGLMLLDPSQLKSLKLKYYPDIDDDVLEQLALALQRFTSLQALILDFSGDYMISDEGLNKLALGIQSLQTLHSLNINLFEASQLYNSVKIIGNAVNPLMNLTDLSLNFIQQLGVDDLQLISFSENLKNLTALKRLYLGLSQLEEITEASMMALAESFEHLPNLLRLTLDLLNMKMLTDSGILEFSSALGNIKRLKSLCLNLPGNTSFNENE